MELLPFLRTQAHANRLANHRLHAAMRALSREDYEAPRTSFFPSLAKTLEHNLAVDLYYLAARRSPRARARASPRAGDGWRAGWRAPACAGRRAAPRFASEPAGEPFWGNDRRDQIERWLSAGAF